MRHILLSLLIFVSLIQTSTASIVELQNRTVNISSNFNIYIYINTSEPIRAFGSDFEYDPTMLQVNYIKFGNMARDVPAGKYIEFQNFNYSAQNFNINTCQYLMAPYNRTGKTTYLTLNIKGKKRGISYIKLTNVRAINSTDRAFFEMYETCRFRDSFIGRDGGIINTSFTYRNDTEIYRIKIT